MSHFCLVRHGETVWNVDGRYQGQSDVMLNATGIQQAESLANELRGECFAAVYTSDLKRAKQTADIIASALKMKTIEEPRLREINQGDWEGQLVSDIKSRYYKIWNLRTVDPLNVRPPGGETVREVAERVFAALNDITLRFPEAKVLIVSHGLALATAICKFKKIPTGRAYELIPRNADPIWITWNWQEQIAF